MSSAAPSNPVKGTDLSQYRLFLGGTVGENQWRKDLLQKLSEAGVDKSLAFNPVVTDWTPDDQHREDFLKENAPVVLFYIADPQQPGNPISTYSIFEAQRALYNDPDRVVVIFDNYGLSGHPLKQTEKVFADLKKDFPDQAIFNSVEAGISYLVAELS